MQEELFSALPANFFSTENIRFLVQCRKCVFSKNEPKLPEKRGETLINFARLSLNFFGDIPTILLSIAQKFNDIMGEHLGIASLKAYRKRCICS